VQTLKEVKNNKSEGFSHTAKMNQVFLLHDNTRPHTGPPTSEATATMGWTVHPRPLYSPDLATSNFRLIGPLKDALPAQHFADDELKYGMHEEP